MRVNEVFKNADSAVLISFQTEALCLLSNKSTPDSAREEALSLAETGETITHQKAKEIAEAHKPWLSGSMANFRLIMKRRWGGVRKLLPDV